MLTGSFWKENFFKATDEGLTIACSQWYSLCIENFRKTPKRPPSYLVIFFLYELFSGYPDSFS